MDAGAIARPLPARQPATLRAVTAPSRAARRAARSFAVLLAVPMGLALAGCTCRKEEPLATSPAASTSASASASAPVLKADVHLFRTSLVVFGSSTPLPISADFTEAVVELGPALQRAAKVRPNADDPVRMRVERDVNYGQLTRVLQAAIGQRIFRWEIVGLDEGGNPRMVKALPPAGYPAGNCFVTAWLGPDQRVQVGIDTAPLDASTGMKGVLVPPRDGRMVPDLVHGVVRRLDSQCKDGHLRLLTQPTAAFGRLFDLALSFEDAKDKPKVSTLQFVVPSVGPLDSPVEVLK